MPERNDSLATASAEPGNGVRPLLEVERLKVHFPVRGGVFMRALQTCKAVDDVSLAIQSSETLGLVGESGCGKTTLGKAIVRLLKPTSGKIRFADTDLVNLPRRRLKPIRRNIQMIFQDPIESLNARHTVGNILEEPFLIHGIGAPAERPDRVRDLLRKVGLGEDSINRFPFEFSGGQRQRIGIARAIALNPKLIICDEPVSALDVSVQSQVLNLLLELQRKLRLSYLFIAHDLAVVKHVSDRIAIMYLGKIVEMGEADEIYQNPQHPYTRALLAAIPNPDPRQRKVKTALEGDVPSPINPPSGCPFHPRCPHAREACKMERPVLRNTAGKGKPDHLLSCHFDL